MYLVSVSYIPCVLYVLCTFVSYCSYLQSIQLLHLHAEAGLVESKSAAAKGCSSEAGT